MEELGGHTGSLAPNTMLVPVHHPSQQKMASVVYNSGRIHRVKIEKVIIASAFLPIVVFLIGLCPHPH